MPYLNYATAVREGRLAEYEAQRVVSRGAFEATRGTRFEALKKELIIYFKKNNIKTKITNNDYYFNYFKLNIKNIIIFLNQFVYRIAQLLIFNYLFKKKKSNYSNNIILIDKYIFPNYIEKERYYNGLINNIKQEYISLIYFVPTLSMIKIKDLYRTYKKLINSEVKYIFKEYYYSFGSIFFSLLHFFRKRNLKIKDAIYNEINFSYIIQEELNNDTIAFFAAVESFLTINFIKKLKKSNISIHKVIDWFENQTVDKAWNYGFNTYFPNVKSLGYKGMAPSQMLQSEMYTLEVERTNSFLPKKIGVIGHGFIEDVKRFNKKTPIVVCPAFRCNYLWHDRSDSERKNEKLKILFALPITIDQSIRILSKLTDLKNNINKLKYEILIKPHPTTRDNIYINYLANIKFKDFIGNEMIGKIEPVELRDVWPHEANDLTPWLRDNIDYLSDTISLNISNPVVFFFKMFFLI